MTIPTTMLLLLANALGSGPALHPATPREAAERFFAALGAGDCTQLASLATEPRWQERCSELVAEVKAHGGVRLLSVGDPTADGRHPEDRLLHATVEVEGHAQELLLRARPGGQGWQLVY